MSDACQTSVPLVVAEKFSQRAQVVKELQLQHHLRECSWSSQRLEIIKDLREATMSDNIVAHFGEKWQCCL